MQADLVEACRQIIGSDITSWAKVHGGDINLTFQVNTTEASYFVKQNQSSNSEDIIQKEMIGLEKLGQSQSIQTPEIIGHRQVHSGAFLILPFFEKGIRTDRFWDSFGTQLAQLHAYSAPQFGFEVDNYIGSLPQDNTYSPNWNTFYQVSRLEPLAKQTFDGNLLGKAELLSLNSIYKKLTVS